MIHASRECPDVRTLRTRRLESREAARNRVPTFEHPIHSPSPWHGRQMDRSPPRYIQLVCYRRKLYHNQNGRLTECKILLHMFTRSTTQGLNDTAARNDALENASDSRAYLSNPIWWAGMSTRMPLFFTTTYHDYLR